MQLYALYRKGGTTILKKYQEYTKDFIIEHKASGVFLDMGLGKTVIALKAIEELIRLEVQKVLVIAPPTVCVSTWPQEIEKWTPDLRYTVLNGSPNVRKDKLKQDKDIYILSNSLVTWIIDYWDFDMVVIDELSAFKATGSQRFRALKKVRPKISRIIGLTGTPTPNHLIELWPQLYLLDGGKRLGRTVTTFRQRYFYPKKFNGNIVYEYGIQEGAEDKIYDSISDICVSMKAVDYLDMPERVDIPIMLKMSQHEKSLYDILKRDYVLELGEDEVVALNAAVLSNKLLQLSQGAVYDENREVKEIHDKKIQALRQIVEESNGQPVLLVYQYKHDLSRIMESLSEYRVRCYTNPQDGIDWNNGEIDVLCIHPASCKYGLNLQTHHIMVWFALTWSLESYQQTVARLWRQGQKNRVSIYYLIMQDTIDERVMEVLQGKEKQQEALLQAIKAVVKEVRRK